MVITHFLDRQKNYLCLFHKLKNLYPNKQYLNYVHIFLHNIIMEIIHESF
jgi:hypothetical protein